jgi:hypothetical protein
MPETGPVIPTRGLRLTGPSYRDVEELLATDSAAPDPESADPDAGEAEEVSSDAIG